MVGYNNSTGKIANSCSFHMEEYSTKLSWAFSVCVRGWMWIDEVMKTSRVTRLYNLPLMTWSHWRKIPKTSVRESVFSWMLFGSLASWKVCITKNVNLYLLNSQKIFRFWMWIHLRSVALRQTKLLTCSFGKLICKSN